MTAVPIDRIRSRRGWTYDEVKDLRLPFDWELVDGEIAVRDSPNGWHGAVRDALLTALGEARRAPYAVLAQQCVLVDEFNPALPDVVVVDETRVDLYSAEYVPVESATLVVEIAGASLADDWFRKPQLYAAAGIAYFWRVERGEDDRPIVYEYWLDEELGSYVPAPRWIHAGHFSGTVPYPVRIDFPTDFTAPW
ncbi:Uma2 family endonuclease [Nocardia transvalensis]|uniref:Uma2 family endonuclease n=1 Tax=Nocardia transvalensis TaxID=37333 RepID=A0A7W9UFY1_9NOCA|nr:Uma2 family endonuclease [Nocardia transvalensis]MBB5911491.1 Uma2 family endonuclease [Nocardia transvalensis]